MGRGRTSKGERVYGPYQHNNKWRVILRSASARHAHDFETLDEALAVRDSIGKVIATRTTRDVIDAYVQDKQASGVSERSCITARYRLMAFFGLRGAQLGGRLAAITAAKVSAHAEAYRASMATETQRMTFAECARFGAWCVDRGHMPRNVLAGLKHAGKVKRGKAQLTIDESRLFVGHCLRAAHAGDDAAIAALVALLCGLRATEIVERIGRDIDDGGTVLWITRSKTEAGKRRVAIPMELQPLLARLRRGGQDRLWPAADRHWVGYHVRRLCAAAGVAVVPPHGLRGTHATICAAVGASPDIVARSLGHTSYAVTAAHYADAGIVSDRRQATAMAALAGKQLPNSVPAGLRGGQSEFN